MKERLMKFLERDKIICLYSCDFSIDDMINVRDIILESMGDQDISISINNFFDVANKKCKYKIVIINSMDTLYMYTDETGRYNIKIVFTYRDKNDELQFMYASRGGVHHHAKQKE